MSNILATGGNSIKLWDTYNYSVCQDIISTNGSITNLSFSQGGQCLASLGTTGGEISLYGINAKSAISIGVVRGVENPTCIQFVNRNTRYLGVGNKHGKVIIWDVKSQSQKKAFNVMSGPVNCIRFSSNDGHIAASTSKGNIYIVSATNNTTTGPFDIFSSQSVEDLMYNSIKRSLLGLCSYTGMVSLFDTYASKMIHTYDGHSAPASAVAFSPINELLMISVGFDKKFNCFNVQTKKPAMTHRSTLPLTSCTFLSGGQHVALGTMTGQVLIHDLRNLRSPLYTLNAHSGKVSSIVLQNLGKTVQSENMNLKVNEPTVEVQKQKNSNQEPTDKEIPTATNSTTPVKDSEYDKLSIFSPIRQTESTILNPSEHENINCNKNTPIGNAHWLKDSFDDTFDAKNAQSHRQAVLSSIHSPVRSDASGTQAGYADITGVLSPIRQTSSVADAKGSTPMTSYGDMLYSPIRSSESGEAKIPSIVFTGATSGIESSQNKVTYSSKELSTDFEQLLQNKENRKPSHEPEGNKKKNIEGKEPISNDISKMNENRIEPNKTNPVMRTTPINKSQPSTINKPAATEGSMSCNDSASPRRQFMRQLQAVDLFGKNSPEIREETKSIRSEQSPAIEKPDLPPTGGELQMSLIRSCVRDVVEELEENVNRRFMNLHSHLVKEFIQQQDLMKELFKVHSLNDELLQEVQRLQEENRHLRANY